MDGLSAGSRLAVGSLPHLDPAAAVQCHSRFFSEIPAWPQMTKRSARESMTRQGLAGIPGMVWGDNQRPLWTLREADTEEALELLISENQAARLDRAAFLSGEAEGFNAFLKTFKSPALPGAKAVKGQTVGPVTLGLSLLDESGKPFLRSKPHMEILVEYLFMHALWQSRQLSALGRPVVFLIDEPSMNGGFDPRAYGLSWALVESWYDSLLGRLQEEGILAGIHTCAAGPWSWVFKTPAEIFHLDAWRYGDQITAQAGEFARFTAKGGVVAWGMVPTEPSKGSFPEPAQLLTRWMDFARGLARKGAAIEEVAGRSFFSTSCGLGFSQPAMAEQAVRCLDMLVTLWQVETEDGSRLNLS